LPIKSFGFSRPMLQLPFFGLPTQLVHAANHIQQLSSKVLPRESFGSPNRSLPCKRSLRYYPIKPSVLRVRASPILRESLLRLPYYFPGDPTCPLCKTASP
jgi:hypothetical protein